MKFLASNQTKKPHQKRWGFLVRHSSVYGFDRCSKRISANRLTLPYTLSYIESVKNEKQREDIAMPRGYSRYQPSKKYSYYDGHSWSDYSSGLAADAARQRDMEAWALRHPRPEVPESIPEPPRPAGEYPLWMWGPKERSIGVRTFEALKGKDLEAAVTIADLLDQVDGQVSVEELLVLTDGSIGPRNRIYIPGTGLAVQKFQTNVGSTMKLNIFDQKNGRGFYTRSVELPQ
jgi:hypothetical protein